MKNEMTDLAAALLRDVPRLKLNSSEGDINFFPEFDVLSALTAALDPALSERAGEVLERMKSVCTCNIDSTPCMSEDDCRDAIAAADLITALLAQIAALRAQIKVQSEMMAAWRDDLTEMALDAKEQRALAAAVPADLAEAGKVVEEILSVDPFEAPLAAANAEQRAADLIAALLAQNAAQEAQIKELQRTYDDLYSDALADAKSDAQEFDSDLWKMVRAYLDDLHFDWRDFMEDGVTADEAMTHIRECMNEETRRAEAAETALAAERAKVVKLREALNTIDALDPEGRIGDCSVNAISGLVLRMGEIARAAITEASQ